MVATVIPTSHQAFGEQRVSVSGLTWEAYQQILHALPASRAIRLTYDQGTLEIAMPLEDYALPISLESISIV